MTAAFADSATAFGPPPRTTTLSPAIVTAPFVGEAGLRLRSELEPVPHGGFASPPAGQAQAHLRPGHDRPKPGQIRAPLLFCAFGPGAEQVPFQPVFTRVAQRLVDV